MLRTCTTRLFPRLSSAILLPSTTAKLHTTKPRHLEPIITNDHIVKSPFPDVQIPNVNVYSHIYQDFAKFGKRTAIIDGVTGREYSFNEIGEATVNLSSAFNRMGLQKNDVVAICAPNCPEYPVLFFGTLASGGTASTCNSAYTADELAYQFKNSGSKIVATIPAVLPTVREAAEKAGVDKIIVIDDSEQTEHGLMSYKSLVNDSGSRFNLATVDAENDIAALPYSSGTTGLPKGVMLTHRNIVANIQQLLSPHLFNLKDECLLGLLPFFHIYGLVVILFSSLCTGAKLVILPKFDPELFLSAIEKNKVSTAHLVPPLVLFLAKHPLVDKYDISSLTDIFSGAAPLGGDLVQAARERLNHGLFRQGYGLTETSPVTHVTPQTHGMSKPSSVGVPVPNSEVKIIDPDTCEHLPAGSEGEVLIRGPNVMRGYLNLPNETSSTITEDGWLRTGDLGYYDEQGSFYITDRLKELIKVKGLQVAPAELEALLQNHPKIADAAVIGIPNEWLGEAPKAFVVKKDPNVTAEEITEFIASKVSSHKHLAGGVEFIDAVPKSASGKILRRMLKK